MVRGRRSPVPAANSGTSARVPNLVRPESAASAPLPGGEARASMHATTASATSESLKLEPRV